MTTPTPEFASVEAFVEYLCDEERLTFTASELGEVAFATQTSRSKIRVMIESYGLTLASRPNERAVRGFTANSHDRWTANPCYGGSGADQIAGFAGTER